MAGVNKKRVLLGAVVGAVLWSVWTSIVTMSLADVIPKGLDKVAAYAGTWKSEVEQLDTAYGKAGKKSKTIRNSCWRGDKFYACEQIIDGESKALLVFTYNVKDDIYYTYAINPEGKDAPAGKLIIEGNTWTYPWQTTYNGKTLYVRVLNVFSSIASIEYRQEVSDDNEHWTLIARGHEEKENDGNVLTGVSPHPY